jgi:hypothetical protein
MQDYELELSTASEQQQYTDYMARPLGSNHNVNKNLHNISTCLSDVSKFSLYVTIQEKAGDREQ